MLEVLEVLRVHRAVSAFSCWIALTAAEADSISAAVSGESGWGAAGCSPAAGLDASTRKAMPYRTLGLRFRSTTNLLRKRQPSHIYAAPGPGGGVTALRDEQSAGR
jgi:hypothetical protein